MALLIPILLAVAGLILAGLAAWKTRRPKQKRPQGRAPAPRRLQPQPVTAPAAPRAPVSPRVKAGSPAPELGPGVPALDLTRLQPAPLAPAHWEPPSTDEAQPDEVPEIAYRIGGQIRARGALLEALSHPALDPKELTDFAMADPALAGEILRVVNSPYYAFRGKVASVFRAVLLLGHIEVRNIVWQVCFRETPAPKGSAGHQALFEGLWRHAFETSRMAYAIARTLQVHNPDGLATAALLHDVGKIIHLGMGTDGAEDLYASSRFTNDTALAAEMRSFKVDHAGRGGRAASLWDLPEDTIAAVRHHHAPSYLPPSEISPHPQTVLIVHLADLLWHLANDIPETPAGGAAAASSALYLPQPGWLELLGMKGMEDLMRLDPVAKALRPKFGMAA